MSTAITKPNVNTERILHQRSILNASCTKAYWLFLDASDVDSYFWDHVLLLLPTSVLLLLHAFNKVQLMSISSLSSTNWINLERRRSVCIISKRSLRWNKSGQTLPKNTSIGKFGTNSNKSLIPYHHKDQNLNRTNAKPLMFTNKAREPLWAPLALDMLNC